MEPELLLQAVEVARAIADLHDPRLIDARNADIFKFLVVDFALLYALDDDGRRAGQQAPELMRLRLFRGRGLELEVRRMACVELGEAFLVGDPDLVEDRLVVDARQPFIDLLRRQAAFLRDGDELRNSGRGDHHMLTDNFLHLAGRLVGDGGGAREKARHGQSLTLDLSELLAIEKPGR